MGEDPEGWRPTRRDGPLKVGFFDRGSRGNPGPGGSGSAIYEVAESGRSGVLLWAAATALSSKHTTNNAAEFVGLHRLLARIEEQQLKLVHVVVDSELILNMMRTRRQPKARKLQHWARLTRRLADKRQIESGTHPYRRHNKAVDWLANYAMDH
ncbi:hypothetical protein Pcac1_g3905 [Phytophthora cactorum]|uniref:RNase H type-1 domain-containing protein n=1 Tax=Phytophthora cactorum TaxID=29920 RepID=A0A329RYT8_9STRA|nr:hypothetical protein Pcac1_g3905 [Phytophthora cactorum]RAW29751.1 hypothetical protein PC110_g13882 [Phytophthora cactorum]